MGKSFKNFLEDGKVKKIEHFAHPAKISQSLRKSKISFCKGCEKFATLRKPIRTPCENFAGHAKSSQTQSYLAITHAKLKRVCEPISQPKKSISQAYANFNSRAKNQRSSKNLFKALWTLNPFGTPHLVLAKTLHHLVTPKLPLAFSPLDALRPTIRRGDLHLSPHFKHGAH